MPETKIPSLPEPTSVKDPQLRRVISSIKEALDVRLGRRGHALDRAVTLRDLYEGGVVKLRGYPDTYVGGGGATGTLLSPAGAEVEGEIIPLTPPPAPTNLVAAGGFTYANLSWTLPDYKYYAYTEIWRNTVDDLGTAVMVAQTAADLYSDPVDTASTYYYWIRIVSKADVVGPYNQTAGTSATTAVPPADILSAIEGSISEAHLTLGLDQRIDDTESGLAQELIDRANAISAEATARASDIAQEVIDRDNAIAAAVLVETNARISAVTALDTRVDTAENNISANAISITALENTVNDPSTGVSANTSAIGALDTRITSAEGSITSQATDITQLKVSTGGGNLVLDPTFSDGIGGANYWFYSGSPVQESGVGPLGEDAIRLNGSGTNFQLYTNNTFAARLEPGDSVTVSGDVWIDPAYNGDSAFRIEERKLWLTGGGADNNWKDFFNASGQATGTWLHFEKEIVNDSTDTVTFQVSVYMGSAATAGFVRVTNLHCYRSFVGKSSAVQTLDTRVTSAEGTISSQSTDITNLENTVNHPSTGVAANASGLSSLDTRVGTAEGNISSQASQITQLQTDVGNAQGDADANATAISGLDTRVGTAEGNISSQASSITQLETSVDSLERHENLITTDQWTIGASGSQGSFTQNGVSSENIISLEQGPGTHTEKIWRSSSVGDSGPSGGWGLNGIPIDHTKSYRSIVWIKKVNNLSDGSYYLGCDGSGNTLDLAGVVHTNPYFANGSLPQVNKWYMVVGIIHGSGYTGSSTGVAGVYDPETGEKVVSGTEFKNAVGATTQTHRTYLYYSSIAGTLQLFARPRFEELNEYAPSLGSLMNDGLQVAKAAQTMKSMDGVLAEWSVKLDVNNRVTGVGLINTGGNSLFEVLADNFAIFHPSASSNLVFGVSGGQTVMSGAYIQDATIAGAKIANATIDTAHIANGAITNAQIGDAAITSAKIAQSIQSDNYDASNGWAINRGGQAVFNNIYARGVMEGSTIRGSIIDGGVFIGGTDLTVPTDADGGSGTVPRFLCYATYTFSASTSNGAWSTNSNFLPPNYQGEGTIVEGSETIAVNYARLKETNPQPTLSSSITPGTQQQSNNDNLYYSVRVILRANGAYLHDMNVSSSVAVPLGEGETASRTHTVGPLRFTVTAQCLGSYDGTILTSWQFRMLDCSISCISPINAVTGNSPLDCYVYIQERGENTSWRGVPCTLTMSDLNENY